MHTSTSGEQRLAGFNLQHAYPIRKGTYHQPGHSFPKPGVLIYQQAGPCRREGGKTRNIIWRML
jgi:hypothetical protein